MTFSTVLLSRRAIFLIFVFSIPMHAEKEPSDAQIKPSPIGGILEPFEGFSSRLGSLLDRLREAPGRQYTFGYQNP